MLAGHITQCRRVLYWRPKEDEIKSVGQIYSEAVTELMAQIKHEALFGSIPSFLEDRMQIDKSPRKSFTDEDLNVYCKIRKYRSKTRETETPLLLIEFFKHSEKSTFLVNWGMKSVLQTESTMGKFLTDLDFGVFSTIEFKGIYLKCGNFDLNVLLCCGSEETQGIGIEVIYYGISDLKQADGSLNHICNNIKQIFIHSKLLEVSTLRVDWSEFKLKQDFLELHSALYFARLIEKLTLERRNL